MAYTEQMKRDMRNYMQDGNVRAVRIALKDILLADTTFSVFDQMMADVGSIPGLWDDHDDGLLKPSPWTDDYMAEQMTQIVYNFSKKRLEHLKQVVRERRPAPLKPVATQKPTTTRTAQDTKIPYSPPQSSRPVQGQHTTSKSPERYVKGPNGEKILYEDDSPPSFNRRHVGAGMVIVGVGMAAGGVITATVPLTIAGATITIAGIAVIVTAK
jgi:hypothetical protein